MIQEESLEILKTGANVFLTGEPGSGKTYVINEYVDWLLAAGVQVAITASTGIAATHIGGMTIHSWSGIGARDTLAPRDIDQLLQKEKLVRRMQKTKVLIIDEISMLDARLLDMVDTVLKATRQTTEPFGGLQIIYVGDFFQLPPIAKRGEYAQYAFESGAWESSRPLVCYLSDQFRQEDELLLGLLKSIRKNEIDEEHFSLLNEQTDISFDGIEPTKLYTHNADVDSVNAGKLGELSGAIRKYQMLGQGDKRLQELLVKNCLSPKTLELKEEAMVMFTKNNFEGGYVNGTLGRVVSFDADDGFPVVETTNKRHIRVKPTSWDVMDDGKIMASVAQLPLRLAWAITVHKSQGMSLDAAEIDLSRAFVFGQGYVALSRVRSLKGLKMLGMSPTALRVDPKIVGYDERFKTESVNAEQEFKQIEKKELEEMHEKFIKSVGGSMPTGDIKEKAEKIKKTQEETTYDKTLKLLQEKLSIQSIAKERNLSESTICAHLEILFEGGKINERSLISMMPEDFDKVYNAISEAIAVCGAEKLKPLYNYTNEQYGYDTIRIARMLYLRRK